MKKIISILVLVILNYSIIIAQNDNANLAEDSGITYFPNLHPLFVHFPLVLLLAAAAMQIGLLFFQNKAYNYAITALTVVGFITGLLAATVFHGEPVHDINAKAHEIFETHEQFAFITLWLSGFASLFKIIELFTPKKWVTILSLLFLLGAATTVSIAGHRGSELVYKQGIGPKGNQLEEEHE